MTHTPPPAGPRESYDFVNNNLGLAWLVTMNSMVVAVATVTIGVRSHVPTWVLVVNVFILWLVYGCICLSVMRQLAPIRPPT